MSAKEVWMNKLSGQLLIVAPYYDPIGEMPSVGLEMIKEIATDDPLIKQAVDQGDDFLTRTKNMLCYHAGWFMQNENGVFFLMPLNISSQFERLGDL